VYTDICTENYDKTITGGLLSKGAITSKIKRAIKRKTSTAKLAQLLHPSLAFYFSSQPMTAQDLF